jgi:exosortase
MHAPVAPVVDDMAVESDCELRAASVSVTSSTRRWQALAWQFLLASALVAVAWWVTAYAWRDMLLIAMADAESSHVLLVPLVFVWLSWYRRERLSSLGYGDRWTGTFVVCVGWFLWSIGYRFQIQCFWHGGSVVLIVGAIVTALGSRILWGLLPAFGVLVFLVPVPGTGRELIALPLQRVTAQATQVMSEIVGMNVFRTGSLLHINGVDVAVAEACNGMRMVFTLFLACYVFAFVNPLRWQARLLVLLMSPVVAVTVNVLRLVPTVWMFGNASPEAAMKFHDVSGWAMLVIAFLGLTGLVSVLRWADIAVDMPRNRFTPNADADADT